MPPTCIADLVALQARDNPGATALGFKTASMDYADLDQWLNRVANGLRTLGMARGARVLVYLPKSFETVTALFGTARAGGVFIPVNPVLKPQQVGHILRDSGGTVLVTSRQRALTLLDELRASPDFHTLILSDQPEDGDLEGVPYRGWNTMAESDTQAPAVDWDLQDTAAILYTSGSTGHPKGVELSQNNLIVGAASVAEYLGNTREDRLLAVLPLSFDYGLSQLTTAFTVGAMAQLMDYLLPRDVIRAVDRFAITGLAGVPPLWVQLARLPWPEGAVRTLRYMTNSGGAMPVPVITALREALPNSDFYLMYGLTEAFRSSYLPPSELDKRPESMGKAIPNVELHVVHEDGSPCAPDEAGELVHTGPLVGKGYWRNPGATAERYKPFPPGSDEIAVWSGDLVKTDADGYLYFVGRKDDMIKSSGYRISPLEVEEVIYRGGLAAECAAFGVPHPELGQAVVLAVVPADATVYDAEVLISHCKTALPAFMVPAHVESRASLPRNPNGKIDRKTLALELKDLFSS
ncbi:MAG: acyl-CoA ligase (AMP-forming), exosortase A system-associated [Gammaproteobacteria bacterium]